MDDLISRQAAIDLAKDIHVPIKDGEIYIRRCIDPDEIRELPSAQPETCKGCKHLGKWENEVEYGYPSPCTRCKRRAGDHYER